MLSTYILGTTKAGGQPGSCRARWSWSPVGPGFREVSQELESVDMVMIVNLDLLAYLHIWVCKEFKK